MVLLSAFDFTKTDGGVIWLSLHACRAAASAGVRPDHQEKSSTARDPRLGIHAKTFDHGLESICCARGPAQPCTISACLLSTHCTIRICTRQ